ncbi:zf-CCHC domain-containing protein [Tanacetum coccineum]
MNCLNNSSGNKQVKDNKIDLFVQKYEEFSITDDETIDCAFSRFNTIITSLKALDESFSSRNHVRKFLRALPSKWRPKVTAIEESKDLSKLSLDELVGNLKVYEIVLEKDLEIAKNKKEKYKSLALKARQVLSDDDTSSSDSNDEEYAMAVRDFKKFFRRRGKFVRQPYADKNNFRKIKEDKKEERRCFKCGDPNHFISDCPKNFSGDQKAFVVGSWSDSGDDSKKEEICLMAHSNEVLSDDPYYSSSSLDNESRENEYDKLGQISLRIINKNKHLKTKNGLLKKTINELKTKLDVLEKGKETSSHCDACNELRLEVNSLRLKLASFENSSSSLQKMVEMQKPSKDKCGLGYTETIASPRNTKIKNLGDQLKKLSVEPACRCHSSTAPASSNEQHRLSDDSAEKGKELETNVVKQNDSVLITKKSILGAPKGNKLPPILKLGQGHGKSKIQTPHKMTHRKPSSLYPKSDYCQEDWNYETQHEQQFQPPMYNQWCPFPLFPYTRQPNVGTTLPAGTVYSTSRNYIPTSRSFLLQDS